MWRMLWTTRSFIFLALAFLGYYGYQHFSGAPVDDLPLRHAMAGPVARQACLALPIPESRPAMAVAPVAGDYEGVLTEQLRQWLARRNVSVVELDWWDSLIPTRFVSARSMSREEAFQKAALNQVPFFIYAKIVDWVTDPYDSRSLELEVSLIDTELGIILYTNTFAFSSESDRAETEEKPTDESSVRRRSLEIGAPDHWPSNPVSLPPAYEPIDRVLLFAVWLASGLVLPWLGSAVIGKVIRSDSTAAGFLLVIAYLGLMGLLAWFLWGRFENGLLTWAYVLVLSTVWLGYLEFVCRMLDNRPEQF